MDAWPPSTDGDVVSDEAEPPVPFAVTVFLRGGILLFACIVRFLFEDELVFISIHWRF